MSILNYNAAQARQDALDFDPQTLEKTLQDIKDKAEIGMFEHSISEDLEEDVLAELEARKFFIIKITGEERLNTGVFFRISW